MQKKQLSEVVWKFYSNGRVSAANQNLRQKDIEQMVGMALAAMLRDQFLLAKKTGDSVLDQIGGMLDRRPYALGDPDADGLRRVLVTDEVLRLPNSTDLISVKPIGGGCSKDLGPEPTQVQPGEEKFYTTPDFDFFMFFVQKGKYIDTYHYPSCVSKVEVERIFVTEETDVPMDIAFEVAYQVLAVILKVKGIVPTSDNAQDSNRNELRYQLEKKAAEL